MRLTLARNGFVAMSMPSSENDFQRARSLSVGLSSAAKFVTDTSPFHVARTAAASDASTETLPFAASVPSVKTTLTRGSTYGFSVTSASPDASSRPLRLSGLAAIGPANATRPRSPTRVRNVTFDRARGSLPTSVAVTARSRTATLTGRLRHAVLEIDGDAIERDLPCRAASTPPRSRGRHPPWFAPAGPSRACRRESRSSRSAAPWL